MSAIYYCTLADVNTRGQDIISWTLLSDESKKEILYLASLDIEEAVNQPRIGTGIPYGYGDMQLSDACAEQVLFIHRNQAARSMAEAGIAAGATSFSDGVSSVTFGRRELCPVASMLVESFKRTDPECRASNGYHFKRG